MKSFLKNYTSDVPVTRTIARIEEVLIRCGVKSIEKEYGPQAEICAIRFRIERADGGELAVRIPADKDKALEALWLDYADGDKLNSDGTALSWGSQKKKRKKDFAQQAERTAWRIMQDWVEVQMSMIQLKQAETVEVFLPFIWDGRETVYQRIKSSGYRALLPQHSES